MGVQLKLIAAACENMGIGKNNSLPWKLKREMAYFKAMTTAVTDPSKKNAVIMGRLTWQSIPPQFRPLRDRINIVISRNPDQTIDGAQFVSNSLEASIELLEKPPLANQVESIWVCGGEQIYREALKSPNCHQIYLTKIFASFDCDKFFPQIPLNLFQKIRDPNVSNEIQEENNIQYQFEVYGKIDS